MTNFVQVIMACEAANGAGTKDTIKQALKTLDPEGRTLCRYAMDPFLVFGVKKYDWPSAFASENADTMNFVQLLDDLAARKITGNAARDAVKATLAMFTEETARYLARVLDKNLQAGFSADSYNKIFKHEPIRVFEVMLADKCESEEDFEAISFPCLAEIKLDGERNVAFYLKEETNFAPAGASYRSRSGKLAEHMSGLFDEELARIREYLGYDFVLDGERMASSYIETINAKKTGEDGAKGKENMRFHAFFLMSLEDWINQRTDVSTRINREALNQVLKACSCQRIVLPQGREVHSYQDMMNFCAEVTSPGFDNMPNGHEGLILKCWDAVYQWKRSLDWCKVKNFSDVDCRCISWEYGKKRNAGVMGRVNVVGFLEDGRRVECGVGSGWTDDQRRDVMENWETKWKDATIVVTYQEVSKGKNKEVHSLRFPTFNRGPRDDKYIEI